MAVETGNPSMSQNSLLNMGVRAIEVEMVVKPPFGYVILTPPRRWLIVKEVELLCLSVGWTEKMMNAQKCWQDMYHFCEGDGYLSGDEVLDVIVLSVDEGVGMQAFQNQCSPGVGWQTHCSWIRGDYVSGKKLARGLDRIAPCENEALGMRALLECHLLWGTHYL